MPRPKRKAVDDTMQAAKRARGETDLKWDLKWSEAGPNLSNGPRPLLVLDSDTLPGVSKVAGFDIDWTVIRTASGRKFATGSSDWEWWDKSVPEKLRSLHDDGFRVVFFTNQAGIEKGKVKPMEIRTKIENMITQLDIPVCAYVCTGTNHCRKPNPAPWEYFEQHSNNNVKVDRKLSVFVGDAAGRAKEWAPGKPKDFSCGDRMFATNLGVKFYTPEEFFLGEASVPFEWKAFDAKSYMESIAETSEEKQYHSDDQELVVMVAPPAAGKSTFSKTYFVPHGYIWVNRDTLSTPAKCLKAAENGLKEKKSVVVDNTNPSASARADYLKLAKKLKVPVRCFIIDTPLELAHHLNMVRMNQSEGRQRRIPDVGYNVYKKNYEEPKKTEGFADIIRIPFTPSFKNDKDKELFLHWTT